jgi:hypothetical protein
MNFSPEDILPLNLYGILLTSPCSPQPQGPRGLVPRRRRRTVRVSGSKVARLLPLQET